MIAIIARAVMSWFDRSMRNPISQALFMLTEPFIAPIRQFMPRMGMIDLSPMIALFIIIFLRQIIAAAGS